MSVRWLSRPRRVHIAAALLFSSGVLVMVIGIYFVALRPALLPEDVRFVGTDPAALEAVAPALDEWLRLVFTVLGGYAFTTGLLIAYIGGSAYRSRREAPIYLIAFAGLTSIGLMVGVNFKIGSDFRWALAVLGALWTISILLHLPTRRAMTSACLANDRDGSLVQSSTAVEARIGD